MFLKPNWPAPNNINAYTTLRTGGKSQAPYDQFNLANHVGDEPSLVQKNRTILKNELKLPNDPIWIEQIHGITALKAIPENRHCEADASFTNEQDQVCVILTADCLPVLICNTEGTHVAAIHAGWRGLVNGIIEQTVKQMGLPGESLMAWLGPAIGPGHFEVGEEVKEQFRSTDPKSIDAFIPSPNQRWLANLYQLARLRLKNLNINYIYGGEFCTYSDPTRFYSYRRDGKNTGRMATLIWINSTL